VLASEDQNQSNISVLDKIKKFNLYNKFRYYNDFFESQLYSFFYIINKLTTNIEYSYLGTPLSEKADMIKMFRMLDDAKK
jgi:hypothetical protein